MKEKFETDFGENGETPNADAHQRYMMAVDLIDVAFGITPKGNLISSK